MNDLIIQAAGTIQADGVLHAEDIFQQVESFSSKATDTSKIAIGAVFWVVALVAAFKSKFSVGGIIAGIIMAGLGTAVLSQIDVLTESAEDTINQDQAASSSYESTLLEAQSDLEGPIVVTVHDQAVTA